MFLDGGLDLNGVALLAKALAALVDHDIASGVLEAVDVGGTKRAFKILDPSQGQLKVGALTNGADVLAGSGICGPKLGGLCNPFCGEPLLISQSLADDFRLLVRQAAALPKISRQLAEEVNEAAVATDGQRVGLVIAVRSQSQANSPEEFSQS